jgi:RimJ/RimL family protein N-acetyltransferase
MIETERLILRDRTDADLPALYAMWADPLVMAGLGGVKDRAGGDAVLARHEGYAPLGFRIAALRTDGTVIGHIGLKPGAPGTPVAGGLEIGWLLARDYWGGGYAREAAMAWLDWAWAHRPEPDVFAITHHANAASRRLMERLGMYHDPALDFVHPDDGSATVTYRIGRPA